MQDGWLRRLLGDPEQATLRAGYSMTFGFERMDRFTGLYGGNPGGTIAATRNYDDRASRCSGPARPGRCCSATRAPRAAGVPGRRRCIRSSRRAANSVNLFDPNIKTPYVHQFSAGFQRSLGRDMAFEVRYVGNRNMNAWTTENWNDEETIFENRFIDEFRLAQANLARQRRGRAAAPPAPARSRIAARAPAPRRCRPTSPTSAA